jgi:hypothetical protein
MTQPFKKRKSAQSIALLLGDMLAPSLRKRGFASSEVITRWPDFIGAQLAPFTRALELKWPTRHVKNVTDSHDLQPPNVKTGATLIVAVSGGVAIEIQHMAPQIIQRINAALGWKCVEKLALRQQPVSTPFTSKPKRAPLLTAEIARLEATTQKIDDDNLRHALIRLGKGVFERNRKL